MKLRIKRPGRIPVDNLLLFLSAFFVSSYALLQKVNYSIPLFSLLKFPILYAGLFCMVFQLPVVLKHFRKRRYFFTVLILAILACALMLSSGADRISRLEEGPVRYSIRLLLYLIELFVLMIWAVEKEKLPALMNFLYLYVLIVVILTDFFLFTGIVRFNPGKYETYLIGNKFNVIFMHMNLLVLWYLRNDMKLFLPGKGKRFLWPAVIFLLAVGIRVDCMTGILGCLILAAFLMLLNTRFQRGLLRFDSPWMLGLFLAVSVLFPFAVNAIMSIPFVEYLVEEIFSRDVTLTGRILVFDNFIREMGGSWLWGYGFGNGYTVAMELFGVANAQNALLQWVMETGLVTTSLLVLLMIQVFRPVAASPWRRKAMPLVLLVHAYILMGTVEITFGEHFFLWIALIFAQTNAKPPQVPESIHKQEQT